MPPSIYLFQIKQFIHLRPTEIPIHCLPCIYYNCIQAYLLPQNEKELAIDSNLSVDNLKLKGVAKEISIKISVEISTERSGNFFCKFSLIKITFVTLSFLFKILWQVKNFVIISRNDFGMKNFFLKWWPNVSRVANFLKTVKV